MTAVLRFALVLILLAGLVACGTSPGPSDGDGDPSADPIPAGQGRLVVTTPGMPDGLVPVITALPLDAADDCQSAECAPSPIDLTLEADLDPGRYAVTAQGVTGTDGAELATLQTRIRIYVPEGTSIEVDVLEGEEVVVEIVFREGEADATPVSFPDPAFEAAVREELDLPSGDVTRADMATLTTLDVTQGQIETQSLEGIEHATNLRALFIGGTAVEDLAPLADLERLEVLYAWKWGSDARIVDASPLAGLTGLEILDLSQNGIQDVAPLAGLTNLTYLSLNVNDIVDVSWLASLTELEYLNLRWNRVDDISALAPLTKLRFLSLYEQNRANHDLNTIDDISAVTGMRDLRTFSVRNNRVADLTPLTNLTQLVTLDLTDNPIRDLRPLAGLVNLEVLEACCAPEPDSGGITTVAALENLESLRMLWIHENFVSDLTPIADLPDLEFVALGLNCLAFEPEDASTGIVAAWRSAGVEVREERGQRDVARCGDGTADLTRITIAERSTGLEYRWMLDAAQRYMLNKPDTIVDVRNEAVTTFDAFYQEVFAGVLEPVDIVRIDVIDTGKYAPELVDLTSAAIDEPTRSALGALLDGSFTAAQETVTVEGRVIAVPWFVDVGLLYYRSDLLSRYGHTVPTTWDQLATIAADVQVEERALGNDDFWGYVWQGGRYEGLTCNALEWIASSGGGTIVDNGTVTLDNPGAVAAIERAAGWIGADGISPPGVTSFAEQTAREAFEAGDALFMRNWPYAYPLSQEVPELVGNVGVALLPADVSEEPVGALGGWNFGVTTDAADPTAAAEFIAFLASEQEQLERATEQAYLPALTSLYDDAGVQAVLPTFDVRSALTRAVARPSDDVGTGRYDAISAAFYEAVHDVLEGDATAADALAAAQAAIEAETGYPGGTP